MYIVLRSEIYGVLSMPIQIIYSITGPQSAPKEHFYNLYNQSWGVPRRWEGVAEKNFTDPVGYFSAYYGVLPSKEETVWTSITTKADNNPYEYMRPNAWGELFGSTPQAARGYFIIDLLNRGPSRSLAIQENGGRFPQMNMKTYEARSDTTIQNYCPRVCRKSFLCRVWWTSYSRG